MGSWAAAGLAPPGLAVCPQAPVCRRGPAPPTQRAAPGPPAAPPALGGPGRRGGCCGAAGGGAGEGRGQASGRWLQAAAPCGFMPCRPIPPPPPRHHRMHARVDIEELLLGGLARGGDEAVADAAVVEVHVRTLHHRHTMHLRGVARRGGQGGVEPRGAGGWLHGSQDRSARRRGRREGALAAGCAAARGGQALYLEVLHAGVHEVPSS